MVDNIHYQAIQEYYGQERSKRSAVLLMNHIDQGLSVLDNLNSSLETKEAFCLHPLTQSPDALKRFLGLRSLNSYNPKAIILALEYRNKANAYLCRPKTDGYTLEDLPFMVLPEVTEMLIADKVQNYKDFLVYHKADHVRSEQLDRYFKLWLKHLGLSVDKTFEMMREIVSQIKPSNQII